MYPVLNPISYLSSCQLLTHRYWPSAPQVLLCCGCCKTFKSFFPDEMAPVMLFTSRLGSWHPGLEALAEPRIRLEQTQVGSSHQGTARNSQEARVGSSTPVRAAKSYIPKDSSRLESSTEVGSRRLGLVAHSGLSPLGLCTTLGMWQ